MKNILINKGLYKDAEIKKWENTNMLRLLASCLVSGKKTFYKEYEQEIREIFNGGSLDNANIRNYLSGWKGVLFVLDTYRKYPALANLLMPVINWLRKKLK